MKESMILAALVFLPMIGGLLAAMIGYGTDGHKTSRTKKETGSKGNARREQYRDAAAILTVAVEFVLVQACLGGAVSPEVFRTCEIPEICGFGLSFTMDGFRLIYASVAALMWLMTTLLSPEYFLHHKNKNRFYLFLLLTLGATMGVFLSADLFTTFIFFEMMSFTSYVWVAQEENAPALRAAETYLAVAVIGGLVMLMGIFLLYAVLGTTEIGALRDAAAACENKTLLYAAGGCMLVGFGAKAGAFPLHIWLPKAHPVAPAPASALLSGILTKTGIFGILAISCNLFLYDSSWGILILGIGVLTMFGGALLAVFSIDLKRTLACSSMSQIGFIMVGIGMQGLLGEEHALAVNGTFLHMVNHSLIKLVLFMAAGVIYMNAHALDLNQIRGFGRKKKLLKAIFLVGALAIGGIPFFGGYISKTLLHESIVEYGGGFLMHACEYIFLFSGGLTVAYMTKLYAAIFVEKNTDAGLQKKYDEMKHYMNPTSTAALTGSAVILFVWGLFPHTIMDRAAHLAGAFMHLEEAGHRVSYFSLTNLSGALISIVIGVLVYLLFIRKCLMKPAGDRKLSGEADENTKHNGEAVDQYVDLWLQWLDLENMIYRPVLLRFLPFLCAVICRVFDSAPDAIVVALRKSIYKDSKIPYERPEGTKVTELAGSVMNFFQKLANQTFRRKQPVQKDYVHILAVLYEELRENHMIIARSLSFGLLLFGIGFGLTMVYIIWW